MSAATEQLVRELAEQIPDLAALVEEHVTFYEEMLPHVAFGDITRWAQEQVEADQSSPDVARLLTLLEHAYRNRPLEPLDVDELIYVSFVENIDYGHKLAGLLGPKLRAIYAEQHGL